MVDPNNITNYNLTPSQLEETLLFWVCAAGKNGETSANCLEQMLTYMKKLYYYSFKRKISSPFELIKDIHTRTGITYTKDDTWLEFYMKEFGIGCYKAKSRTFRDLAHSNLDLEKCTVEDLEGIKGIGPKTARCFIIHSRPDQPYAGLDTHILKFLRDEGYDAPKSTPNGKKYRELEQVFIRLAKEVEMTVADYDLYIWKKYRNASRN